MTVMIGNRAVFIIFAALGVSMLAGCVSNESAVRGETIYLDSLGAIQRSGSTGGPPDSVSYWDGDGVGGSPSIRIDLGDQKAYFYKSDQLVGVSKISTGREGYRTPTGSYKILQKNANHRSNLYGEIVDQYGSVLNNDADVRKDVPPPGGRFVGAPMPNFMRITNGGVGMHAGYLPGFPASHGCIRMPDWMSRKFFENVNLGTPVKVTP